MTCSRLPPGSRRGRGGVFEARGGPALRKSRSANCVERPTAKNRHNASVSSWRTCTAREPVTGPGPTREEAGPAKSLGKPGGQPALEIHAPQGGGVACPVVERGRRGVGRSGGHRHCQWASRGGDLPRVFERFSAWTRRSPGAGGGTGRAWLSSKHINHKACAAPSPGPPAAPGRGSTLTFALRRGPGLVIFPASSSNPPTRRGCGKTAKVSLRASRPLPQSKRTVADGAEKNRWGNTARLIQSKTSAT